jgi:hypothetical protein
VANLHNFSEEKKRGEMAENNLTPSPEQKCLLIQMPNPPSNNSSPKQPGYPDFNSLLLASCGKQGLKVKTEEKGCFLLDLSTCSPLLRKAIMMASKHKLEQESKLDHVSIKYC